MEIYKDLDPDFLEDLLDSIAQFEVYLFGNGYDSDFTISFINGLYRLIHEENKREYGLLNSIIIFSSGYPDLQQVLFNNYLHRLLIDVYTDKIHEKPKQMLYGLNQNIIRLGDSPLKALFLPLLEYAKNHVLLGDDFMKQAPGDKTVLLSDILVHQATGYQNEIQELVSSTNGKPAKLITLLWAMYKLKLINESYSYLFSDPIAGHPVQISKIATDISKRPRPIAHSSVSEYDPRSTCCHGNTNRLIKDWQKELSKIQL